MFADSIHKCEIKTGILNVSTINNAAFEHPCQAAYRFNKSSFGFATGINEAQAVYRAYMKAQARWAAHDQSNRPRAA